MFLHVVSLRKAMLVSTQLKDEDGARVSELEGLYSDALCSAVSSRAEPTLPLFLRHTLLMEEFLPSSLSQLAWLRRRGQSGTGNCYMQKGACGRQYKNFSDEAVTQGLARQLDPEQP